MKGLAWRNKKDFRPAWTRFWQILRLRWPCTSCGKHWRASTCFWELGTAAKESLLFHYVDCSVIVWFNCCNLEAQLLHILGWTMLRFSLLYVRHCKGALYTTAICNTWNVVLQIRREQHLKNDGLGHLIFSSFGFRSYPFFVLKRFLSDLFQIWFSCSWTAYIQARTCICMFPASYCFICGDEKRDENKASERGYLAFCVLSIWLYKAPQVSLVFLKQKTLSKCYIVT